MLVNLTASGKDYAGYKTISNVMDLSRSIDDSEAREIYCRDFLSSFPLIDVSKVLNLIVQKLRIGGRLIIEEVDFNIVSLGINRECISVERLNERVFGGELSLRSILTSGVVGEMLAEQPLKLVSQGYDQVSFTMVLERV